MAKLPVAILTLLAAGILTAGKSLPQTPPANRPATRSTGPVQTPPPAVPKRALAVGHAAPALVSLDEQAALVKQYCAVCHSEKGKAGGLSLAAFDPAKA